MKEKYTRIDMLAKDRTYLANERTLLAYWRTSLALFVLGAFMLKFLEELYFIVSLAAIASGCVLFIFGTYRFFVIRDIINKE